MKPLKSDLKRILFDYAEAIVLNEEVRYLETSPFYLKAHSEILKLIEKAEQEARLKELEWVDHNIGEMGLPWLEDRLSELREKK